MGKRQALAELEVLAKQARRQRRSAGSAGFAAWIERTIELPVGLAAEAGPIVLPPYMREIAEAMTDPEVERLTLVKASRVGYSTLISGLIAWHMVEQPAPVLVVVPAELDARNFIVATEDIFETSPTLQGKLPSPATAGRASRNTILYRRGGNGASLRLVGATAPRNLRAVGAKILVVDEADALQLTAEGDAIALAERRTLAYPDRRLIVGSTPLDAATSHVERLYAQSDQRVYEVPCVHCKTRFEINWSSIQWPEGRPEAAHCVCPTCGGVIEESHKRQMVSRGRWRALRPEAGPRHQGYRLSALVSSLANVSWGRLAEEYELVKDDPDRLRVFRNTCLALPWEEAAGVDETALAARAEPFSIDDVPAECLVLTMGVDCADDRLEAVICGWSRAGVCYVLAHEVIHGPIDDDLTWQQLDELLHMRWKHPAGTGTLKIDACAIDGGDGGHLDAVLSFTRSRSAARVMCVKGAPGFSRHALLASKSKMKGGGRLWIVGSDSVKARIFDQLQRGTTIRFSQTLQPVFFEQLASERRVVKIVRGRPVPRFERIRGARAESLDAVVYSVAAKSALLLTPAAFNLREDALTMAVPPPPRPSTIKSRWMDR